MFPGNSSRYVSRAPSRLPAAGSGARFVIDRKAAGSVSVPRRCFIQVLSKDDKKAFVRQLGYLFIQAEHLGQQFPITR
jgi:hypothetical protein